MIPKSNLNKGDASNYRPISITPCISKLFEKVISFRLVDFLDRNKIMIDCQSGFRKHRQTKDNIFYLVQKIKESFNRKKKGVLYVF